MQSTIPARPGMRPAALGAAALGALITLSACGSSGTSTGAGASTAAASTSPGAAVTQITVYGSGSITGAPLRIAAEKGYFKAVGLDVKIVTSQSGQNLVPLLLNGQATIASLDTPTTITAVGKNIPIVAIAPNEDGEGTARGGIAVVAKSSSITSWASLAGKTIAVNVLQGTQQILTEASMHNAGVNSSSVKFVETGSPTATIAALNSGRVDAALLPEPVLTTAIESGLHTVANPEQTTIPNVPAYVWDVSKSYAAAHPAVIKEFDQAILKANAAATASPSLVNSMADTFLTPPEPIALLNRTHPFLWGTRPIDDADITTWISLLQTYGGLSKSATPSAADVFASSS